MQLCSPIIMSQISNLLGINMSVASNIIPSGKMHVMSPIVGFPSNARISKPVIFGIDIPIFYPAVNPLGTVVLIGQDPLRNPKDRVLKDTKLGYINKGINPSDVIIGTPFALHFFNNPNGIPKSYKFVHMYNDIVNGYLTKGYNVYLTDISKLYVKESQSNGNSSFKVLMRDPNYQKACVDLLCSEISQLKKVVGCIFLGKTAHKIIENELKKCPCINNIKKVINHPSDTRSGTGHWDGDFKIDPHCSSAKISKILDLVP